MSDHWLSNLAPVITFLFILAAFGRRAARSGRPRPARAPRRSSIVPAPLPPAEPSAAAVRPVRRRPLEPPSPPAPRRAVAALAAGGLLPAPEAAAAFPELDLSLGDASAVAGTAAPLRRARRVAGGLPIGSPGWAVNAVLAAEILGTPVGLRPGATVGVPHAF